MKNETIAAQWNFNPLILILIVVIIYSYYRLSGFKPGKNNFIFFIAVVLLVIAECSPLNYLAMHYYFSAHMITHIILLLLCGPLLILSIPARVKSLTRFSAFLAYNNWVAWLAGVGVMWFWHIPAVFNSCMADMQHHDVWQILHTVSLLFAGMLFSWPLFGPFRTHCIHPLHGVVYLFTACISCSLLGLLITFAPQDTYHQMAIMAGKNVNPWGLSQKADTQAAGLIMWVPCCFIYLLGCLYLLQRWFAHGPESWHNNHIQLHN